MVDRVLQKDVEKQLDAERKPVVKGQRKEPETTTPTMMQAEGEAHVEEAAELDAGLHKEIENVGEHIHEKAKAQKTGKSSKKEPKPKQDYVNAFGFIHLRKEIAEEFGAPKGVNTPITIEVKDGVLMVRKV